MRVRGIHYDIGTTTLDGSSTRPTLERGQIERELADIADGLHGNAVRITGGDLERLRFAGQAAAGIGLQTWLSPMLPNADAATTLEAIGHAAAIAEDLRAGGGNVVLVVGCEVSAFMAGIIPGENQADRLALLTDLPRLLAEVATQGFDPQDRFDAFLTDAVAGARAQFAGPLTYASGTWEQVDWSRFDLAGIDAYRDAGNRDAYVAMLRAWMSHGKPLVITEVGCATYRGSADLGSLAWTAVDRGAKPRRLKEGIDRDEVEQATEIVAVLDLIASSGAEGAFIYTYAAPSYPSSQEGPLDLDTASYALVRTWPDGTTERKAAFTAVADRYGRDG